MYVSKEKPLRHARRSTRKKQKKTKPKPYI